MTVPAKLITRNANRFAVAKLTRGPEFVGVAVRLVAAKARYQAVEKRTGVPWYVIAVIHQRESSQDFARSLAQGDPWDRVSVRVPKGRGPFRSWEEAAIDALVDCHPHAARWKDWSVGGTLALLESYNGLGYYNKGIPSPYIWSGTDQYQKGKYVRDGVFDPDVIDKQLGCAGLILAMQKLDPSIDFGKVKSVVTPETKTAGGMVAGGVVIATTAAAKGASALEIAAIAGAVAVVVFAAFVVIKHLKRG